MFNRPLVKTIKLSEQNADFFERVYAVVTLIPSGRVTSYGAIANYLGSKRSSRMVGWAMNGAHRFPSIAAHRVVNRNGMLTGKHHFEDPTAMQSALEGEGHVIVEDKIVGFSAVFWNPSLELKIE